MSRTQQYLIDDMSIKESWRLFRIMAEIVDGYADVHRLVQVDGLPMVRMGVRKQSGANTVEVAAAAKAGMSARIFMVSFDIHVPFIVRWPNNKSLS